MSDEKKYRLLIADDERIERAVLYKTLKNRLGDQCEIYQAENGREALELYDRYQIQIAVLDIPMPSRSGRRIRTAASSSSQPLMNFPMRRRRSPCGRWITC